MFCGKEIFAFIPNVEILTLLTALYGYTFGIYGIVASVLFVTLQPIIYGFGPWIISYYLYWPFVALVFMLLRKLGIKNRFALAGAAVLLTIYFGVLTTLVDIGLFMGRFDDFFYRFSIMYSRGIVFFAIQIACNAVLFPLCFPFFARLMQKFRKPEV